MFIVKRNNVLLSVKVNLFRSQQGTYPAWTVSKITKWLLIFPPKSANGVCTLELIRITTIWYCCIGLVLVLGREVPFKMSDLLNPIIVRVSQMSLMKSVARGSTQ